MTCVELDLSDPENASRTEHLSGVSSGVAVWQPTNVDTGSPFNAGQLILMWSMPTVDSSNGPHVPAVSVKEYRQNPVIAPRLHAVEGGPASTKGPAAPPSYGMPPPLGEAHPATTSTSIPAASAPLRLFMAPFSSRFRVPAATVKNTEQRGPDLPLREAPRGPSWRAPRRPHASRGKARGRRAGRRIAYQKEPLRTLAHFTPANSLH